MAQAKKIQAISGDIAVDSILRSHEEPVSSDDESLLHPVSTSTSTGAVTVKTERGRDALRPVSTVAPADMEAVSSDEETLGVTTSKTLKPPSLLETISSDDEAKN